MYLGPTWNSRSSRFSLLCAGIPGIHSPNPLLWELRGRCRPSSLTASLLGLFLQRLNSLQELQLLEIMCSYFQEQSKDSVRQIIFSSLFSPQGNKADDSRMSLLGKLVSMAVAVCRIPVLECAASWLQVLLLK